MFDAATGDEIFDRDKVKTLSLIQRKNKITLDDMFNLEDNVPDYKDDGSLFELAKKIAEARKNKKEVILMTGAHLIRRGNSRFIIDLMKRGLITHIAANGACAIHDFELALIGATCEDVEFYIKDGKFGNWEETGKLFNQAIVEGYVKGCGLGKSIGMMISGLRDARYKSRYKCGFKHSEISVFSNAYKLRIPITVHKTIGTDITDQHKDANFPVIGWTSGKDFLIFTETISRLEGGVFLNISSQVTGPEVYLKALSMARNVADQKGEEIKNFTTTVFDIVNLGDWKNEPDIADYRRLEAMSDPRYYFRPLKSILIRTVKDGGESFYIKGDLGVTFPNLYKRIIDLSR